MDLIKKATATTIGVLDTTLVADDGSGAENFTATLSNPDNTLVTDNGSGAQNFTSSPTQPSISVSW